MRVLELPVNASPRQRGQIHGETFRPLIREIANIRTELALTLGRFETPAELELVAARHIPLMQTSLPALFDEMTGIAEGSGLSIEHVIVLNHYTDLRDLDPQQLDAHISSESLPPEHTHKINLADIPAEEDCTALYAQSNEGVFLGQTWDMHGSAAPYVMMLHVPAHDEAPEAWCLSITGCLGLAGMNAKGIGITINNLRSTDARIGLIWPALVRAVLEKPSVIEARDVILDNPVGSGHHYLVASEQFCYAIETSGTLKRIVFSGEAEHYVHTNHCLDAEVAHHTAQAFESTSQERYDLLVRHLRHAPIRNFKDMWVHLGSHSSYPRSICSHLASVDRPHASRTCGGIAMDLSAKYIHAASGCIHRAWPHAFEFIME